LSAKKRGGREIPRFARNDYFRGGAPRERRGGGLGEAVVAAAEELQEAEVSEDLELLADPACRQAGLSRTWRLYGVRRLDAALVFERKNGSVEVDSIR
jgi:hypothetical protein